MSDSSPRKLRVVPFSPNDYSLGEVIGKENGAVLSDSTSISAAMSLYFQWEKFRTCRLYSGSPTTSSAITCELDYDRDERTPTEIWVKLSDRQQIKQFSTFQLITTRFEVFRTCYEFSVEIIAINEDPDTTHWDLIIKVPERLTVYKSRRLPRLLIDEQSQSQMKDVCWLSDKTDKIFISILELGTRSICVTGANLAIGEKGTLKLPELSLNAEVTKVQESKAVLVFHFRDNLEYGRYFDFYRKYAYPSLRSRYEFPFKDGLELYKDTNYLGKFKDGEYEAKLVEIEKLWSALGPANHLRTADYYIVNEENKITGASSATLSYLNESAPVWIFHQLCAHRDPDLLEQSGQLYSWRAEYLAARPEDLVVGVWFDSKSRWLERIYTKFAAQNNGTTKLTAVNLIKCTFTAGEKPRESFPELKEVDFGSTKRIMTTSANCWAGLGPKFLNASDLLDSIVYLHTQPSAEQIAEVGQFLATLTPNKEVTLRITVPNGTDLSNLNGELRISDRFCYFPKSDLVDFLNSVEHSVAITQRKYADE